MVVNSPLIRPAISWGNRGIGGVPLGSHDKFWEAIHTIRNETYTAPAEGCWRLADEWQLGVIVNETRPRWWPARLHDCTWEFGYNIYYVYI